MVVINWIGLVVLGSLETFNEGLKYFKNILDGN
jgi:hypothetical protein